MNASPDDVATLEITMHDSVGFTGLLSESIVILATFLHLLSASWKHSYQLATAVETVYHLKNNNIILPFSFLANLIQTLIFGSKKVTTIVERYLLEEAILLTESG